MIVLTPAEQEVLKTVAKGWDYGRISDWLGIAPCTARTHVKRIARKLPPHGGLRGYTLVLYWGTRIGDAQTNATA